MSGGSPKPKWTGRLNTAVRRSSTMLSFGRSSSSRASSIHERESRESFDGASITKQKVDTTPATLEPPAAAINMPSPISESPLKERAATDLSGPSPLGQGALSSSLTAVDATSPVGYVPPPLLDSSLGNPGAFTDPDDELPQPILAFDPHAPPKPASTKGAPSTRAPSVRDAPASVFVPQVEGRQTEHVEPGPSREVVSDEETPSNPIPTFIPEPEPTQVEHEPTGEAASYLNPSKSQSTGDAHVGNGAPKESQVDPTPVPLPMNPVPPIPFDITGIHPMPVPSHHAAPASSHSEEPLYRTMPIDDMSSGAEIWGTSPRSEPRSNGSVHLDYASLVGESQNGDSKPPPPQITLSPSQTPSMPHPQPAPAPESRNGSVREVNMPLPALHDVIPSRSTHKGHSTTNMSHYNVDADETRPLLATSKGPSYLHPATTAQNTNVNVSPMNRTVAGTIGGSWNPQNLAAVPRLHDLGWIEYHLPDGTFYYVHPTRRVTTDVNLRAEKALNSITAYLENVKDTAPSGCELWLRDVGTSRKGFVPSRSWVNHQSRSVVVESGYAGGKKQKAPEEDQLDQEYRYWSFIEGHPAHTTLPMNAKTEAFEALSWAWTDRLLPSNQVVPAPFSQDECQELNSLLRSFTADQDGIQTRLVARILIRVAIWRQAFFRPNKPLPKDVVTSAHALVRRRRPIIRTFFDIVISILCLGIPYIFFERHSQHRIDEESNFRSVGPMFIIGACTCIVAAIVLSASVTFLSLPGLDSFARIAGLVATLFASFSMAATLVTIFKYKADMVRSAPQIGEGIMWVSKRSLIFSLPMVFLAYAIIGFIAGIILYSVRDVGLPNSGPGFFVQQSTISSTRWTTVGAVGALAGAVTMSFLLSRR